MDTLKVSVLPGTIHTRLRIGENRSTNQYKSRRILGRWFEHCQLHSGTIQPNVVYAIGSPVYTIPEANLGVIFIYSSQFGFSTLSMPMESDGRTFD